MNKLTDAVTEIRPMKQNTLDELWHEAESLGQVSVESDYRGEIYSATIRFERKSGTSIRAKGTDQLVAFALSNAIDEAREMGAGTQS